MPINQDNPVPEFKPYSPNVIEEEKPSALIPSSEITHQPQRVQPMNIEQQSNKSKDASDLIALGGYSPAIAKLKDLQSKKAIIDTMPVQDKNGKLKSGLKALLDGMATMFDSRYGVVKNWGDFGNRMAAVGGKTLAGGLLNPEWDESADREKEKLKLQTEIENTQKQIDWETDNAYKRTQTENIRFDNNLALQKQKSSEEEKAERLKEQKRTSWYKRRQFFDPTKATEADVKQLAEIGETPFSIGHYDFTKPSTKVVNGVSYLWNSSSRSFEDSNLPKDNSKAVIDYKVTDPSTGVEYTYSTTQEKAANLKTQLITAGMQITAANQRQESQQNFTANEKEKDRAFEEVKRKANAEMTAKELLPKLQDWMKDNSESMEKAMEVFKKNGFHVDEIMKRQ